MGLFKEVKKPVIKHGASSGADVSARRPTYAAKTAPCIHSCVNGADVREWLVTVAQHQAYGRTPEQAFEIAWRTILETNPFPAVCGRVCQHPCELNCNRKAKDGPVAIRELERFIGDFAIANGLRCEAVPVRRESPRIAVVGAGPAGLSAAYHLRRKGYAVTLIEAAPQAGGMMRYAIPRSVIPAEVLDAEIGNILQLGIELRTGCQVGRDVSMEQLRRDYGAIFFAMGLQKAAQLKPQPGTDGQAIVIGALPAEAPRIAVEEAIEVQPRVLNMVSAAIAQGRAVAEILAAQFECCSVPQVSTHPVIRSERVKLDWYPKAQSFNAASAQMTAAEAVAEAARCMSCGMCMDCETCWMYCSKNCFVKLSKGEHYKLKVELCNGCGKCADVCPCGYIEMN
ncbi:MAG: FAD-dependent oxidoreductase [Acidobacteriota bacterium]